MSHVAIFSPVISLIAAMGSIGAVSHPLRRRQVQGSSRVGSNCHELILRALRPLRQHKVIDLPPPP